MNIPDLFVVLAGYWPHSSPDIDDPVAVAAHSDILGDLQPDAVHAAVRAIALEGREFCPPPGVIASACKPRIVPPYRDDYVPELVEAVVSDEQAMENIDAIRGTVADLAERKRLSR